MAQVSFYGSFFHTTDPNSRVVLPLRFRSNLGEKFRVVGGPDGRLCVMSTDQFESFVEELLQTASKMRSMFDPKIDKLRHALISNTEEGSTDQQGRMQITEAHRLYAGIGPKSEVVITGVGNWCEIWSKENWEKHRTSLTDDSIREAGLSLGEVWSRLGYGREDGGISQAGPAEADD